MKRHSQKGFTLIELIITCAIIALLTAIAIPQLLNFRLKSIRAEAIMICSGAAKAQLAYYAGNDHFLLGCIPAAGSNCTADHLTQTQLVNDILGLPYIYTSWVQTAHGYRYNWHYDDSLTPNFELRLGQVVNPQHLFAYPESIYLSVNGHDQVLDEQNFQCTSLCGWQNGIPFIFQDGITNATNCPCN